MEVVIAQHSKEITETGDGRQSVADVFVVVVHRDDADELRAMPATADGQSLASAADRSTIVRGMAPLLQAIRAQ